MLLKDITLPSPEENILYDEILLQLAERHDSDDVLRLWESPRVFIVLGRTSSLADDVDLPAVRQDGVPVLRRYSGGGTVVQGKGCLNFSLILSKGRDPLLNDLRRSYEVILNPVLQVMRSLGVAGVFHPVSDLALQATEKKFSGNAQHRGRKYILHHGTVLYDFDLSLITKYLKLPKNCPAYRLGRDHRDFVANIPVEAGKLRAAFCEVFNVQDRHGQLTSEENGLMAEPFLPSQDSVLVLPGHGAHPHNLE